MALQTGLEPRVGQAVEVEGLCPVEGSVDRNLAVYLVDQQPAHLGVGVALGLGVGQLDVAT